LGLSVDVEVLILNVPRIIIPIEIVGLNGIPGIPFLVTVAGSRRTGGVGRWRGSRRIQKVALAVAGAIIMGKATPAVACISAILPNNGSARVVGERDTVGVLSHALYRCVARPSIRDQFGGVTLAATTLAVALRPAAKVLETAATVRVAPDTHRARALGAVP